MDDWMMMNAALQSFNNTLANNANVIMASNQSDKDRKFSREMSDLAWERNIEAWQMQNAYNLPRKQYRRQLEGLIANGLNPNLVYGNSSLSARAFNNRLLASWAATCVSNKRVERISFKGETAPKRGTAVLW